MLWKTTYVNWLTAKLGVLCLALVTIVKYTIGGAICLWLIYIVGMALTNTICDCVRDFNGWWELKYWIKKEGA